MFPDYDCYNTRIFCHKSYYLRDGLGKDGLLCLIKLSSNSSQLHRGEVVSLDSKQ